MSRAIESLWVVPAAHAQQHDRVGQAVAGGVRAGLLEPSGRRSEPITSTTDSPAGGVPPPPSTPLAPSTSAWWIVALAMNTSRRGTTHRDRPAKHQADHPATQRARCAQASAWGELRAPSTGNAFAQRAVAAPGPLAVALGLCAPHGAEFVDGVASSGLPLIGAAAVSVVAEGPVAISALYRCSDDGDRAPGDCHRCGRHEGAAGLVDDQLTVLQTTRGATHDLDQAALIELLAAQVEELAPQPRARWAR